MQPPQFRIPGKDREQLEKIIRESVWTTYKPRMTAKRIHELIDKPLLSWVRAYEKAYCLDREKQLQALRSVLHHFAGRVLDNVCLWELTTLLVTHRESLHKGEKYTPWNRKAPAWGLFFIEDMFRKPGYGRLYVSSVVVHGGQAAGESMSIVLRGGFLQTLMREAGFSRYEHYADTDAAQLWFCGRVFCEAGKVLFDEIYTTSQTRSRNAELSRARRRGCILGEYPACALCRHGVAECPLARHKGEYLKGMCINEHEGWITPNGYCLDCSKKGLFQQKERKA